MRELESIKNTSQTAVALQSNSIVDGSDARTVPIPTLPPMEPTKDIKDGVEGMADDALMHNNVLHPTIFQL